LYFIIRLFKNETLIYLLSINDVPSAVSFRFVFPKQSTANKTTDINPIRFGEKKELMMLQHETEDEQRLRIVSYSKQSGVSTQDGGVSAEFVTLGW